MHVKIEDWKNGWSGISVGIDPDEINRFIELLKMIRENPEQHFHVSSDYKGTGGVGDIEVFIRGENEEHNMSLSGRALAPGETLNE
ncbi:MAG: hypothetical protein IT389_07255 [Nitrospira sp.]|nr:hypothetical protein [Nitrospira sp.]